jgi:GT2 family glycosyltransferase
MFEMLLINRLWPGNPVNRRYRCLNADYSKPFEAEQPAGAFLMIRRDCWEELGGFDEGFYPLWFEDADYCARARKAGFRILFTPEAVAKHTGGHTIAALTVENRQLYWYGSLLRYAARHFRGVEFRAICLGVIVGSFLRMVTGIMVEKSLAPLRVYARAAALAARSLAARRRG